MENQTNHTNHTSDKRFALSTWAVDNRTTVMVITVLIALIGIHGLQRTCRGKPSPRW